MIWVGIHQKGDKNSSKHIEPGKINNFDKNKTLARTIKIIQIHWETKIKNSNSEKTSS